MLTLRRPPPFPLVEYAATRPRTTKPRTSNPFNVPISRPRDPAGSPSLFQQESVQQEAELLHMFQGFLDIFEHLLSRRSIKVRQKGRSHFFLVHRLLCSLPYKRRCRIHHEEHIRRAVEQQ